MICGNQGDLFITNNKEDYQSKCKFLESSFATSIFGTIL